MQLSESAVHDLRGALVEQLDKSCGFVQQVNSARKRTDGLSMLLYAKRDIAQRMLCEAMQKLELKLEKMKYEAEVDIQKAAKNKEEVLTAERIRLLLVIKQIDRLCLEAEHLLEVGSESNLQEKGALVLNEFKSVMSRPPHHLAEGVTLLEFVENKESALTWQYTDMLGHIRTSMLDASKVYLNNFSNKAFVDIEEIITCKFDEHFGEGSQHSVNVTVTDPEGKTVDVERKNYEPGQVTFSFTPLIMGPHTLRVLVCGEDILGSPLCIEVYEMVSEQSSQDSEVELKDGTTEEQLTFYREPEIPVEREELRRSMEISHMTTTERSDSCTSLSHTKISEAGAKSRFEETETQDQKKFSVPSSFKRALRLHIQSNKNRTLDALPPCHSNSVSSTSLKGSVSNASKSSVRKKRSIFNRAVGDAHVNMPSIENDIDKCKGDFQYKVDKNTEYLYSTETRSSYKTGNDTLDQKLDSYLLCQGGLENQSNLVRSINSKEKNNWSPIRNSDRNTHPQTRQALSPGVSETGLSAQRENRWGPKRRLSSGSPGKPNNQANNSHSLETFSSLEGAVFSHGENKEIAAAKSENDENNNQSLTKDLGNDQPTKNTRKKQTDTVITANISALTKTIQASYVRTIGEKGVAKSTNALSYPIGVTVNGLKDIIVCDTGNKRVRIYDWSGNLEHTIGAEVAMQGPSAVVTNQKNEIFVKDDVQILVFSSSGRYLRSFGKGLMSRPYGLVWNSEGNLVTLDVERNRPRVLEFSPQGKLVRETAYGPLLRPKYNSKCRFLAMQQDRLVVADLGLNCVYITQLSDGKTVQTIGEYGKYDGQFNQPSGVASDNQGNLIVADSKHDRVQVFTRDGEFAARVQLQGLLKRPSGIHLTEDGHLLITNLLGHNVKVFKLNPPS